MDIQKQEIYFYEPEDENGEYSNFYPSKQIIDGKEYSTNEHYYQSQKFIGTDDLYAEKIRTCASPAEAFSLGNAPGVKYRDGWIDLKYSVMKNGLLAKFTQNEILKNKLLETGDAILIENSEKDYIWGCGKEKNGQNLLGKALMEIRAQIILQK